MDKVYHVPFTKEQIEAAIGKGPILQKIGDNAYWALWDIVAMEYVIQYEFPALVGDLNELLAQANRADAAAMRALNSATEAKKWADQAAENGGSSGGDSAEPSELEDYSIEVGQFTNAAAGWCTYKFREAFDDVPRVTLQPVNFSGWAEIRNITKEGFQYCLRQPGFTEITPGSVATGSFYTATGTAANSAHEAHTLVTGVNFPQLPTAANKTTSSKIVVNYIAIEYGGER